MIMTMTNSETATFAPLLLGAEVWCPIDGQMMRQAAAPSIGDLDQAVTGRHAQAADAVVELAVSRKSPAIISIQGADIAALAWPVVDRDKVSSVVVLYVRVGEGAITALEVWTGRAGRSELCISGSRYAGLERFARLSPYIAFPKGSGLPGLAWETGIPQIVDGLGQSPTFMRATGAESEGLEVGFALPCIAGSSLNGVVLMLSDSSKPIARVFETWLPEQLAGALRLARHDGAYIAAEAVAKASQHLSVPAGDTWIGRAWATRQPAVVCDSTGNALQRLGAAEAGLSCGVAIPIIALDDVAAVAVLMW